MPMNAISDIIKKEHPTIMTSMPSCMAEARDSTSYL